MTFGGLHKNNTIKKPIHAPVRRIRARNQIFTIMAEDTENINLLPIKNAFIQALSVRGIYKTVGLDRTRISHIKAKAEYGDFPSYETMKSILQKCGYEIKIEERWVKKS